MTVHKVETRWLKFLREQKNIKLKKSHCSGAMETPETAHEKIGTYMWADCFFALHQFFFFILMHQMIVSLPSLVMKYVEK